MTADETSPAGMAGACGCAVLAPPGAQGVSRRRFLNRTLFAAGTVGAGLGAAGLARATVSVAAKADINEQVLRTAAAIENLAVAVYAQASALPASVTGAGNPVIQAFLSNTARQHAQHAATFNAALAAMNVAPETGVDTALQKAVVAPALATLKAPIDVVALALKLEDATAQSYVSYAGQVDPAGKAFGPLAAIAPVEAQHVAVLLAVQGLLVLGAPQLIQIPAPMAKLPAAAGDAAFPFSFYQTGNARPVGEEAAS